MKKKILITGLFVVYVIVLFIVAKHYKKVDDIYAPGWSNIGKGIRLQLLFILISLVGSFGISIIAAAVYASLNLLTVLRITFGFILVATAVMLFSNFIFWITRLEDDVSPFIKIFTIATISTAINTIWHMSKSETSS